MNRTDPKTVVGIASELHTQVARNGQRRLLLLEGDARWGRAAAHAIIEAFGDQHPQWIGGDGEPGALPPSKAAALLGGECGLLIIDAHGGFDADALGAAAGTLRGGGLLLLLAPTLDAWPAMTDPETERIAVYPYGAADVGGRFIARLGRLLAASPAVVRCAADALGRDPPAPPGLFPEPRPESAPKSGPESSGQSTTVWHRKPNAPRPLSSPPTKPATADQERAIEAVHKVAAGRARRPLVLSSDRGRGKSAALGIAAGQLLADPARRIIVTAPRRAAAESVFRHAEAVDPDAAHRLRFVAPDALLADRPPADLLLVDEAAGIPAPLLERMLRLYGRIVFATTVHGYEGTGRGFDVRFRGVLDRITPGWRALRLLTPIRWAADDPLEQFIDDALLLNAEPAPDELVRRLPETFIPDDAGMAFAFKEGWREHSKLCDRQPDTEGGRQDKSGGMKVDRNRLTARMQQSPNLAGADELLVEQLDRDQLASDEALLRQVFGLLVLGHYQTRPADLRHLLDGPNMQVSVLRGGDCVLATALTAHEGRLPEDLLTPIYDGQRRPRGHLLPQTLSAHAGLFDAPRLGWTRIVRIAVHPAARGRGLGSRLVQALAARSRAEGRDLLGASFGATPELLRFWRRCGLLPVQLGSRRNAASGAYSAVVLSHLSDAGGLFAERARRQLLPRLQVLLAGPLSRVDAPVIAELLRGAPGTEAALDSADRQALLSFAGSARGFDAALPVLHRLTTSTLPRALASNALTDDQAAALIACVLQHRDWADLGETLDLGGQKELLGLLRSAAGALLESHPSDKRSEPRAGS